MLPTKVAHARPSGPWPSNTPVGTTCCRHTLHQNPKNYNPVLTGKQCASSPTEILHHHRLILAVAFEAACHLLLLLPLCRGKVRIEPVEAGADADFVRQRGRLRPGPGREQAPCDTTAQAGKEALGGGIFVGWSA